MSTNVMSTSGSAERIVRIKFGSHLYGTNTPESDLDYKAVYIPSADDILLQRVQGSLSNKRAKSQDGEKNVAGEVDEESYALQRYLGLLSEGQTVAIDMLFAPCPLETSDLWRHIRANKGRLLTKKSAAFVGYCRTQANKYGIKGSRVAAAKKAKEFFESGVGKLGGTAKVAELSSDMALIFDEHTRILEKETTPGRFETYLECCNRLVGFNNTVKEAAAIYARIYENYGSRARLAENNEGVDWKALSHAVRVGQEALELLATGNITFPLQNAAYILQIKQGRRSYDDVAGEIESLLEQVESTAPKSSLRDAADIEFIESLVKEVYGAKVRDKPEEQSHV